ncbi:MAG: DUF3833 family protein [Hyphomonadaceae bacterium]
MPTFIKLLLTLTVAGGLLTACATAPARPSNASEASFVLERDLLGRTTARGDFRAITGTQRGFTAHLSGSLTGEVFTLIEDFVYDDGERDRKTWVLTRQPSGEWSGTREDVIGAARGYQDGPVFRLEYDVRLPSENGRGRQVRFRDLLALDGQGAVLNNANVGWFGFRVARVSLVITRDTAALPQPNALAQVQ